MGRFRVFARELLRSVVFPACRSRCGQRSDQLPRGLAGFPLAARHPVSPVVDAALGDSGPPDRPGFSGGDGALLLTEEASPSPKRPRLVLNELLGTDFGKTPCDSTLRLLLAELDGDAFEPLLEGWMAAQPGVAEGLDTLVCDGKSLRASLSDTPSGAATVSAQTTSATDAGSETPALREPLESVEAAFGALRAATERLRRVSAAQITPDLVFCSLSSIDVGLIQPRQHRPGPPPFIPSLPPAPAAIAGTSTTAASGTPSGFSRLWVVAIRCHPASTFSRPRNRKRRRPRASLIWPFTGSAIAFGWP